MITNATDLIILDPVSETEVLKKSSATLKTAQQLGVN